MDTDSDITKKEEHALTQNNNNTLGTLIGTMKSSLYNKLYLLVAIALLLLNLPSFVLNIMSRFETITPESASIWIILARLLLILFAVFSAVIFIKRIRSSIDVYDNALVFKVGKKTTPLFLQDIIAIDYSNYVRRQKLIIVLNAKGTPIFVRKTTYQDIGLLITFSVTHSLDLNLVKPEGGTK